MTYFTPDRSNRAGSSPEDSTREIGGAVPPFTLSDGRPVVMEQALVDSYHCVYYYFDTTGLEEASKDQLLAALRDAGAKWPREMAGQKVYTGAEMKRDAQARPIWEVQITMPPLD